MSSNVRSIIGRSVIGRAVHVKVYPRLRNLSESRQILHVLQRYGDVVTYKNLKYELNSPSLNTIIAIFQTTNAVENLLQASPLRVVIEVGNHAGNPSIETTAADIQLERDFYEYGPDAITSHENYSVDDHEELNKVIGDKDVGPKAGSKGTAFQGLGGSTKWNNSSEDSSPTSHIEISQSKSSRETAYPASSSPQSPGSIQNLPRPPPMLSPKPTLPPQQREFQLTISRSWLNHEAYIQRQGYYGPFNPDLRQLAVDDLAGRVPLKGMADCRLGKEEAPLRVRLKQKERENNRKTLRQLWEEGMKTSGQA